jgi:hypothetical protein
VLLLRHLDADGVAEVLSRLVSVEGLDPVVEELRRSTSPTDALVTGVLAVDAPELHGALAQCHQLTPRQIQAFLRHAPDAETVAALFPGREADATFSPVRPLPGPSALSGPAAAEAALLDRRCPSDLAVAILDRYPRLAYVARTRHQNFARVLRSVRRPMTGAEMLEVARLALSQGALTVGDFVEEMRPASATLDALSALCGERPLLRHAVSEALTTRLARACASDPAAWGRLVALLPAFEGTVGELLDVVAESEPGGRGAADRAAIPADLPSDLFTQLLTPELVTRPGSPTRRGAAAGPWPSADWEALRAVRRAVEEEGVTADEAVHTIAPARHTLSALHDVAFHTYANPLDDALARYVHEHLDGANRADSWAVLVQLLPDFEGTLWELLTVSSAVAG